MSKLIMLVFFMIAFGCQAQQLKLCDKGKVQDLNWLAELLEDKEKAVVFTFKNKDETILELHHCYQCPDALVMFYNCSGEKICEQGGFLGVNTCPEFNIQKRIQVYPIKKKEP